MRWYQKIVKEAEDWGHGDTLEGQYLRRTIRSIRDDIERLRNEAETDGLEAVMPRWRGEIKRKIFLLPPMSRVSRMSMHELKSLAERLDDLKAEINKYNQKRFSEAIGANYS